MTRPILGFLICVICWGLAFIVINLGVSFAPALWMDFFWVLLAFFITWAIILAMRVEGHMKPYQKGVALLLGIPGSTLFIGLLSIASSEVLPGAASVVTYTSPIWVLLLSVVLLRERLTPLRVAAVFLGFAGIFLIARITTANWGTSVVPYAELLVASLGWAITNVLFKKLYRGDQLLVANLYQFGGSLLPFLLWAGISAPLGSVHWGVEFLGILAFLALFGTAIPTIIWFRLVSKYDVSSLATYTFLVPVVSLSVSVLALGERLDGSQIVGIIAILVSIYMMSRKANRK